ncbi:MAG: hypothetical protein K2J48_09725 [Muribaculaceae bacterium]|nr:hypothetical protein [Muribaculaceae bacterium]
MIHKIDIDRLHCLCSSVESKGKIAYILYPMDMLAEWIEPAAEKYGVTIVVVTGMDWQNVFSPWAAPGVPKGTPDFKGESPEFLKLLQEKVIPKIETDLGMDEDVERTLVGVSMSGLFALWQWMLCDTFRNIASLSGSFWYEGFVNWIKSLSIPKKTGKGYFLLGDQESKSKVKKFATVGIDTHEILQLLSGAGIDVEFQSVPGNHYSDPIPRLDHAFAAL